MPVVKQIAFIAISSKYSNHLAKQRKSYTKKFNLLCYLPGEKNGNNKILLEQPLQPYYRFHILIGPVGKANRAGL